MVAEDVHKVYTTGRIEVHALRGINLKIKKGEMVVIMGPSGCGKTTLLNVLSGLDDPTSGRIFIEGKDISAMSDNMRTDYRGRRIGFIFQSYNLIPVLSAVENVELPLLIAGKGKTEARQKAMEALELVGLRGFEEHLPSELSGGQQQRVAIARSLVNEPAIVFADEPTGNLDTENSRQIMLLLSGLNKKLGQTYVIVTHDERLASFAHRIVRMENGRIISRERKRRL